METRDLPGFVVYALVGVPEGGEEEEGSKKRGCDFAGGVEPHAV
jgi:hypothetical protein